MAFAVPQSLRPSNEIMLPAEMMPSVRRSRGDRDTDREFALQKYYLLHHEQDSLRRRLSASSLDSSRSSSLDTNSPFGSSPAPRPATHSLARVNSNESSNELPVVEEDGDEEIDEDSWKQLQKINHQIKATLTSLLNCESVKHDERTRRWVTERLMDAEKELRKQRKFSIETGGGGGLWKKDDCFAFK